MKVEIVRLLGVNEGKEAEIELVLSEGEKCQRRTLLIPREAAERLKLVEGELSMEDCLALDDAETYYRAMKKAMDILAYGRNSRKTLIEKLRMRGFEANLCERVADEMTGKGFLRENEDALREAECAVAKLWGSRRVLMHLHEKGYSDDEIEAVKEDYLSTVDWVALCEQCIRARYKTVPKAEAEHRRVIAGLVRYGYSFTEIKAAVKRVEYYRLPGDI